MKLKNKGITLIALVITIIILLILAGVTIGQLAGNGLFEKVQLAKEMSEQAQRDENETLMNYENMIEDISGNRENIKENINIPRCTICINQQLGGDGHFEIDVKGYSKLTIDSRTRTFAVGTTYWTITGYKEDNSNEIILNTTSPSTEKEQFDITNYEKLNIRVHCTVLDRGNSWATYYYNNINIMK